MPNATLCRQITACLLLLLCYRGNFAVAHDSNIATFQIRRLETDQWIYEVMAPLYGLDQSMRASSAAKSADISELVIGSTAYKQQIVAHIKEGFEVRAISDRPGDQPEQTMQLSLGQGRIKLDDHLSVLIFEIKGMPEMIEQLDFHLGNMSNNEAQNNVLRLIDGERKQRYILNAENGFAGQDIGFFR